MKVLFFAFPQYADFEVAHTLFFLRKLGKAQITTITVDGKQVESVGGLHTLAHLAIEHVIINEYDLVLLPGGDGVDEVLASPSLLGLLQKAATLQIPIASICASSTFLAKAGLLHGKEFTCLPGTFAQYKKLFEGAHYTEREIEINNGFITAKGTAFPLFTLETCKLVGLVKDEKQADSILAFCRGTA